MAELRDRPHGNSNFVVEFGSGASRSGRTGFAEVVFPPFTIAGRPAGKRASTARVAARATAIDEDSEAGRPRLVLRRGVTGALDLYAGWDPARRGKAPPRRVMSVKLLADDHATVVWTWRFSNVRPVSLAYSPLRGIDGGVLMETIELSFDDVEMA
ncbi:MAG: phage tail protein [Caldimonas sp.]